MKKWNKFLNEQKEEVLQEFNRADEADVMKDENKFSVSFEIEMEADGVDEEDNWEAMEQAMDQARREQAENYFGDAENYFRETIREQDVPDGLVLTDGSDFWDWYYDYVEPMTLKNLDLIRLAVAHHEGMNDTVELLAEAIAKYLKDPMKFMRALINNSHARNELQELLGWNENQLTLPFEKEGGKAYHPGYERLIEDPKILFKILNYFVGKLHDLQSKEIFAAVKSAKSSMSVSDFFKIYNVGGSNGFLNIINAADETIEGVIMGIPSSYGSTTYADIFDNLDVHARPDTWEQRVLDKYFGFIEAKMEEIIEEQVNDYEEDPAGYLEEMGYEGYFDEETFREEWYDSEQSRGGCNLEDMQYALSEHFPNFMSKYEDDLKFEEDGSLNCGIEFSMDDPPYMIGLDTAIEFLTDFFEEYDEQSYFSFTQKTGLHTNVGYLNDEGDPVDNYNLFKALMFINHRYATKGVGFPNREFSSWAGDLKAPAIKNIQSFVEKLPEKSSHEDVLTKDQFIKKYLSRNFNELSDILSSRVLDQARQMGSKSIGFNVNYTPSRNYIEFRYPGETDPNLESMTKALKYYAFVVKASADEKFKKKEYLSDLVGFINNLQGEKVSVSSMTFHRKIKKGDLLYVNNYAENIYKIFDEAMDQSIQIKPKAVSPDADPWTSERARGREAYGLTNALMTALATSIEDVDSDGAPLNMGPERFLQDIKNRYPVIYRGMDKKGNVILDVIKYSRRAIDQSGKALAVERVVQSAKSFQLDFDSGLYLWSVDEIQAKPMRDLIKIVLSAKSHLEISRGLFNKANDVYTSKEWNKEDETIRMPQNYEWVNTPAKPSEAGRETREDLALTDQLVDTILSDYLE
mgnify:FL=1|tara:strand:+ start:9184 stop:11763 length:2580 start_codon:yes stop_codon:yes gene_type:complete